MKAEKSAEKKSKKGGKNPLMTENHARIGEIPRIIQRILGGFSMVVRRILRYTARSGRSDSAIVRNANRCTILDERCGGKIVAQGTLMTRKKTRLVTRSAKVTRQSVKREACGTASARHADGECRNEIRVTLVTRIWEVARSRR